jgi:hypothetical protein
LGAGFIEEVLESVETCKASPDFNTTVENYVEKQESIFVSNSWRDASASCTQPVAGTLVVFAAREE